MENLRRSSGLDVDVFQHLVSSGAALLNLSITGRQVEQLVAHAELLIAWNKKINLTRITSVKDMAVKHFLDSMTALPYLPKSGRVLDIGSGAGFPGLVLKIMRPELEVTLIDGVRKKASFLQHVIRTLKLKNISVHHARAEEFKNMPSQEGAYQAVLSRALSSLRNFVMLASPFLAPDGLIIAYKGKIGEGEWNDLLETQGNLPTERIQSDDYSGACQKHLLLPHTQVNRTIVIIRPG